MNLHPKVKAGAIAAILVSILTVGASLADQLPTAPWAVTVAGVCAALLPIVAAWAKSA